MSHLEGEASEASEVLVEVSAPPPETGGLVEVEAILDAPSTGTEVAATLGQLQVQVADCQACEQFLQDQINALRADVSLLAREEFNRLLEEIIQEESEEAKEEATEGAEPLSKPKRRHANWWAG